MHGSDPAHAPCARATTVLLLIIALLSGCTSTSADNSEFVRKRYFGFVELTEPATEDRIRAVKVQVLGLALDEGVTLGWMDAERVSVPIPEAAGDEPCGLIVIVRSDAEARHARSVLEELEGASPCIANFNPE